VRPAAFLVNETIDSHGKETLVGKLADFSCAHFKTKALIDKAIPPFLKYQGNY